ncbi:MAG: class II D-tagatose-bisphosphate aldolase, non-catalytic subunit [Chloroflexi bacterium]|nr:class II D-tagatose-bisphosphate aldolase, non-catalytic subunit [Chloroflexota bacterium]
MTYWDLVLASRQYPPARGIVSVCSAHPFVIGATLSFVHRLPRSIPVLIESTSNQVNPEGGYTGMTPKTFAVYIRRRAKQVGVPRARVYLGGDHLGPLPWAHLPPEQAMARAETLVAAYVRAGYTKIHLDCSMPLGGETRVDVELVAARTAALARVAEAARPVGVTLRYVIGSEVPPAGGAKAEEGPPPITRPEQVHETLTAMQAAFARAGLHDAWQRVLALVVQPGVEFGAETVHVYQPGAARALTEALATWPQPLVYEAHSTDYQPRAALRGLVDDGFAILKVGPALTFAFREAVFALEAIERELGVPEPSRLREVLEQVMLDDPRHWQRYYPGSEEEQRLARAFGLSDRIRYYWLRPQVQRALDQLFANVRARRIPWGLLHQYLPTIADAVRAGQLPSDAPRAWVMAHIQAVLEDYAWATRMLMAD